MTTHSSGRTAAKLATFDYGDSDENDGITIPVKLLPRSVRVIRFFAIPIATRTRCLKDSHVIVPLNYGGLSDFTTSDASKCAQPCPNDYR